MINRCKWFLEGIETIENIFALDDQIVSHNNFFSTYRENVRNKIMYDRELKIPITELTILRTPGRTYQVSIG